MFVKLVTLALALPLVVSAFTINALQSATSSGQVTITWSATTSDPQVFSIELFNQAFNNVYAIANNVATAQGTLTLTLPEVPATSGYTLQAINPSNVNQIYSTSGDFSIGATSTSTTSVASTSSVTSTSSLTFSTPSSTATIPTSSHSSVTTTAATSASSSASATPSALNSGAAPLNVPGMVPAAALLLSAVAGAAMVF